MSWTDGSSAAVSRSSVVKPAPLKPDSGHLVRAVDRAEGGVEVFGEGVGGGEGVVTGLDRDGAVAAGGRDELLDGSAGRVLDSPTDGEGGEHDGQVRLDRLSGVVVDGRAARSDLLVRKLFSTFSSRL